MAAWIDELQEITADDLDRLPPDPEGPTITVLRLDGGRYAEVTVAGPHDVLATDEPFPVEFVVDELPIP